jgi:hypothetical protein
MNRNGGTLGSAPYGAGWPTIVTAVLYGMISVAFTAWFIAIIRARCTGSGSLLACAGQASDATYLLHPLLLTAIMVLFASLALSPEPEFLIVAAVAVPACFLAGLHGGQAPRHLQGAPDRRKASTRSPGAMSASPARPCGCMT